MMSMKIKNSMYHLPLSNFSLLVTSTKLTIVASTSRDMFALISIAYTHDIFSACHAVSCFFPKDNIY